MLTLQTVIHVCGEQRGESKGWRAMEKIKMKKILVIGSGPIVIGQAAEFDYAGTQACLSLKEEGVHVVLVNNNPATIMTDPEIADTLYMEPLSERVLEDIIAKERPDGLIASIGGQTGLNLANALAASGVLDTYGIRLLGTPVEAIRKAEDRALFRSLMMELSLPVVASQTVETLEEGLAFAYEIGYPLILRPAFTLGGEGGGMVSDEAMLREKLPRALDRSPIHQVLVEKSIHGWKEIEYEVMRDGSGDTIIVTTMENIDPVGVHTGDSAVVAPMLTVSEKMQRLLDEAAHTIASALGLIGGANVQFAVHPEEETFCVIEVNPRVSRSSALASKATGYPIAYATAKVALGYRLSELKHPLVPGKTLLDAPTIPHRVVKLPRFPFDVFPEADTTLGTQMQATGEVMGLGVTVHQAFNKALRALDLDLIVYDVETLLTLPQASIKASLEGPRADRITALFAAFYQGRTIGEVAAWTHIHPYFLTMIQDLAHLNMRLYHFVASQKKDGKFLWTAGRDSDASKTWVSLVAKTKWQGIGDRVVARHMGLEEADVRRMRIAEGIVPTFFVLDPYGDPNHPPLPKVFYSAYANDPSPKPRHRLSSSSIQGIDPPCRIAAPSDDETSHPNFKIRSQDGGQGVEPFASNHKHDVAHLAGEPDDSVQRAIVLGSGAIRIGQGIEFDYASVHALFALKAQGLETIVINHNPETVSTDFSVADRLYMEPLALEDVLDVILHEKNGMIMLAYGGQSSLNLGDPLRRILLESPNYTFDLNESVIKTCEERKPFYELLDALSIPHPVGYAANNRDMLLTFVKTLGFPLLVRPSYVIGGTSMMIIADEAALERALGGAVGELLDRGQTLLVDRYIEGSEFEADLVSDGEDIYLPGFFEHVEPAGIHSGDSIAKFPAQSLSKEIEARARAYASRIARGLGLKGLLNIQYIVSGDTVYVLEVNPRASRTVPIVGKITGQSLVKLGAQCALGRIRLKELELPEINEKRRPVAIKAPVFSTEKLSGVDPLLGPVMRSTGEVLAISWDENDALYRSVIERRAPLLVDLSTQPAIAFYGALENTEDVFSLFRALLAAGGRLFLPAVLAEPFLQSPERYGYRSQIVSFADSEHVYEDPNWWKSLSLLIAPHLKGEGERAVLFRKKALQYGVPVVSCLETAYLLPALRREDGVGTLHDYTEAFLNRTKHVPTIR